MHTDRQIHMHTHIHTQSLGNHLAWSLAPHGSDKATEHTPESKTTQLATSAHPRFLFILLRERINQL